ncbi:energy transducer TonB [Stenotrophomonas sp. C1657]|uniref:energy transducer TonB n=1 Tax=Stenotrophomonas sp. C1657 TaxID=3077844 RepID=UPI00293CA98E|nr:energy transducer TonB [Stenotrophomonas sp. C1657]MDV3515511.1 energy transducer TonB [Stenotrophomonas sp. C1657]
MIRSSLFLALALAVSGGAALIDTADAQTAREVRRQAEASMTLSGVIDIGREGQVEGFQLDHREKVDAGVAGFVDKAVQSWRFEPTLVDGKPMPARTTVHLRLIAGNMEGNSMQVRVVDARFGKLGGSSAPSTDDVTAAKTRAPVYPPQAASIRGQGTVMLLVKVGRDGKVADVIAEQTNLTVVGPERTMNQLRDVLAKASVRSAREWTFNPPTTGEDKDRDFWTVRVPVNYFFDKQSERYGRWSAYIPGPRQQAPWKTGEETLAAGSDLLPEGGVYMVGRAQEGPRLLTPLG